MAPPRPLMDVIRELNQDRDGAPSHLLRQMRAATEGWKNYAETAQGRQLVEAVRRIQESGLAERLMGRMRPLSPSQPDSVAVKRKRGTGRKPSHPGAGQGRHPHSARPTKDEGGGRLCDAQAGWHQDEQQCPVPACHQTSLR